MAETPKARKSFLMKLFFKKFRPETGAAGEKSAADGAHAPQAIAPGADGEALGA